MNNSSTVVGLDVHKDSIVAAVLPARSAQISEVINIGNSSLEIKRLVERITRRGAAEFVYEAGPCGYEIWRQITGMGTACSVIAPGLTPKKPGDRVKTDRRDAENLARYHRAGELTEVNVPTRQEESVRDLLRAREDLLQDRLRARHRTRNFLQRHALQYGKKLWGVNHEIWLKAQKFEYPALTQTFETYLRKLDEANAGLEEINRLILGWAEGEAYKNAVKCLRCFKGVDTLGAITILAEAQDLARFGNAREFMSYTGLVGSEYSSGERVTRGGITKAGNAHIRRVLVESAWAYRHRNVSSPALLDRRKGCPAEVVKIARKAQDRLTGKFWRMLSKGKKQPVIVVAIARELAGFIWSMSRHFPAKAA